jgi:secreted trypsin-like serine protease
MAKASATSRADQLEHVALTRRLARMVAGDDDRQFVLVFQALINVVDPIATRSGDELAAATAILDRTAAPMVSSGRRGLRVSPPRRGAAGRPPADSLYSDPVFLENAAKLIANRARIVGGVLTTDFPDCVAVGSGSNWCCTGTLVAPNVVVTAGHCVAGGCANRVFVGPDVTKPRDGKVITVTTAEAHPKYGSASDKFDIAVLVLGDDAPVPPRAMATKAMVRKATSARVAGYGNTDVNSTGGYGQRRMVDVPMASDDARFGADPRTEFVAGAPFLDRDSCNGDSGGPAYVRSRRKWYVAGATSRATVGSVRPCGDGGIYTKVHSYAEWVRSVPGGRWE